MTTTTIPKDNNVASLQKCHLDWTAKQGRILTANGRANEFYSPKRGFEFAKHDLPHFHLMQGDTSFATLKSFAQSSPVCGAWSRTYFVGGWEHSSFREETVYNVQTNSLFVDLRIPTSRNAVLLPSTATCLDDYSNTELGFYARQHVFGGMSVVALEAQDARRRPVCVRHHALDWNFVGVPRPRPNKWWIELCKDGDDVWKEWAYATDDYGQHYYCEQWERLEQGGPEPTLALRKERQSETEEDGILVLVGNHFNYIRGCALVEKKSEYENASSSLVELVDAALEKGDRETALAWLGRIDAGHGRIIADGTWMIDCAIQPWKEGTVLFTKDDIVVEGKDMDDCRAIWNAEQWNVFESTLQNVQQVKDLLLDGI